MGSVRAYVQEQATLSEWLRRERDCESGCRFMTLRLTMKQEQSIIILHICTD